MFFSFSSSAKGQTRKQRHSLKLGKKRRESSKGNYYIISPRVIIKATIIITTLEGVQWPRKLPTNLGNAFSDALLMSRFQNFVAAVKEKIEIVLHAVLLEQLIA